MQYSSIVHLLPDNIDVEILPAGDDKSTIAIYSRRLLARDGFGTNRARIDRCLGRTAEHALSVLRMKDVAHKSCIPPHREISAVCVWVGQFPVATWRSSPPIGELLHNDHTEMKMRD